MDLKKKREYIIQVTRGHCAISHNKLMEQESSPSLFSLVYMKVKSWLFHDF